MPVYVNRRLRRTGVIVVLAVLIAAVASACTGDKAPEKTTPPTTGAKTQTNLVAQWKYESVVTPDNDEIELASTNAWLLLNNSGSAQGQDGRPWQGKYETGQGWISFDSTHRATAVLEQGAPKAIRVVSEVTTKLLSGNKVEFAGPKNNKLTLSIDGYTLTLDAWN